MIIPKKVINKEFTFPKICGYAKKDPYSLNGIEREAIKRIKEGNFDPRKEIKAEITGSYMDQGSKHTSSITYGLLEQLEEIRKITMDQLDKMGIKIIDTKDADGRKKIEMKLPKTKYKLSSVATSPSESMVFDIIMKAVLKKYMNNRAKYIKESGC